MNFWQGKKIRLRAVEPTDAETFYRWNLNSERAGYLDFIWPPSSMASVKTWVEAQSLHKLEGDTFHWVIEDSSGTPVGSISTHDCQPHNGTFSYGIDVAPEHQGRGYAGEAIWIVLRYYFEELRYQKVTVPVQSRNKPSIRLHEKLGFQREGQLRRMIYTDGKYDDMLYFGITREEFHEKQPRED